MPPTKSNSVAKFPLATTDENLPESSPGTMSKVTFMGTPLPTASTPIKPEETLIFLDWDDTCIASTWLQAEGFKMYDAYGPMKQTYIEMGESLSTALEPLITRAAKLGRVVIVTNANEGWVELSCQAFMPKLLPLISNFSVISAQDRYKHITPSPMEWKRRTFEDVVAAISNDKLRNFISIGDGIAEKYAVQALRGSPAAMIYRPMNIVKTVKLMERPTPSELVEQLITANEIIESVVHHPISTDIEAAFRVLPDSISKAEEEGGATATAKAESLEKFRSAVESEEMEFFLGLTEI